MSTSTSETSGTRNSIVFDSDVLIWALRGDLAAAVAVENAPLREITVVSYMELVRGAQDKAGVQEIRRFLVRQGFRTLPLTESIGQRASVYMEEYGLAVAMSPVDAIIAATCVENHRLLCTGNVRHFRAIQELELRPFKP